MPSTKGSGPTEGDLERHRRDIEALDRRVLHLICERLELARRIGELKEANGIPLRNFEVEEQVHHRFEEASRFLGLEPGLGRDLALFLIQKAVEEQASLRDTAYDGEALSTLVVGGKGGMGSWFARFLRGQGHRVVVWDPGDQEAPFEEVGSLADGARDADLIVVSVPMDACASLLEELAELEPGGVVAEICSLKGHLAGVMDDVRRRGLRLVSCHPLFGPDTRMLSGRTVVFCSEGRRQDIDLVRGLFARTSANLVEMDAAEHDRRMGLVLGLTHLSNLVFARALGLSGVAASHMAEVAGVTFCKQLATTREVCRENPQLYYQIQALNRITGHTAEWLKQAVDDWMEAIAAPDGELFEELMTGCRGHLSDATRVGAP